MVRYTTDLSVEQAQYIADTLAPNSAPDVWPAGSEDRRVIALTEAQVAALEVLPADSDAHVDAEGILWIGGVDYPLTVVHNA